MYHLSQIILIITTIEMKEELYSFSKKKSTKSHNFWENATIDKIDERCLVRHYYVLYIHWNQNVEIRMLKSDPKPPIFFPQVHINISLWFWCAIFWNHLEIWKNLRYEDVKWQTKASSSFSKNSVKLHIQ